MSFPHLHSGVFFHFYSFFASLWLKNVWPDFISDYPLKISSWLSVFDLKRLGTHIQIRLINVIIKYVRLSDHHTQDIHQKWTTGQYHFATAGALSSLDMRLMIRFHSWFQKSFILDFNTVTVWNSKLSRSNRVGLINKWFDFFIMVNWNRNGKESSTWLCRLWKDGLAGWERVDGWERVEHGRGCSKALRVKRVRR